MPENKTLEANLIQSLVEAINLVMRAHDFCPDSMDIKFVANCNCTERADTLSVKVNGTSVTIDLFHQYLRPVYGELDVREREF